ncbi:uncharacterized protein LAJ45_00021 [Morchella importuna]|uniref:uncharacterized protein n=1 Tax=Morchella importuna TaxID=1174673 RepID=UPI001E8E187B|nr:uncharacterized protein LAJ45_00021 [Morchella importuna]KAH8155013.1 hypothetical protein LAJ45_00021 [Morchella importuna]
MGYGEDPSTITLHALLYLSYATHSSSHQKYEASYHCPPPTSERPTERDARAGQLLVNGLGLILTDEFIRQQHVCHRR